VRLNSCFTIFLCRRNSWPCILFNDLLVPVMRQYFVQTDIMQKMSILM
jgi:hypothetical protein